MRNAVNAMIQKHGTDMMVSGKDGEKSVRAFFWAVNSKSWQSMESEATLLGEISRGQYAYLGPAEVVVQEGDTLTLGGRSYLLRRVERFYYQNQPLYLWGLCVERGVNDTWGTQS